MPALVRVLAGVLIRRAVAAQRDSTCLARPEMHPIGTDLYAFFAFATMRLLDRLNRIQMRATSVRHYSCESISRYEQAQWARGRFPRFTDPEFLKPQRTTSAFHDNAREYVAGLHQKIILLDGRRLAELMIEHGIGVAEEHTYSVKKIDSDYFEET
jgi:hypothetical protein